jgi:hypothetical protein
VLTSVGGLSPFAELLQSVGFCWFLSPCQATLDLIIFVDNKPIIGASK